MNKLTRLMVALAATAVAAGPWHGARAQTVPPVPAVMPPIASHADPTLPVPTTPPELIASPARLRSDQQAQADLRRLESAAWARFVPVAERRRAAGRWASTAD